jgi:hypothetical protein
MSCRCNKIRKKVPATDAWQYSDLVSATVIGRSSGNLLCCVVIQGFLVQSYLLQRNGSVTTDSCIASIIVRENCEDKQCEPSQCTCLLTTNCTQTIQAWNLLTLGAEPTLSYRWYFYICKLNNDALWTISQALILSIREVLCSNFRQVLKTKYELLMSQ